MAKQRIMVEVQVLNTCVVKEKGAARQRIRGDRLPLDLEQAQRLVARGDVSIITPAADYMKVDSPSEDDAPEANTVDDTAAPDVKDALKEQAPENPPAEEQPSVDVKPPDDPKSKSKVLKGSSKKG